MDSRQLLASQRDAANQQLSLVTDMMMRMEEANLHLQQQNQTLQADNQRLQERNTTLQADNLRLQEQNRVLLASIATAAAASSSSSSSSSTPANRVRSGEPHLSPPPQQQQSGAESLNPQQQQQPQVPPNVQVRESLSSQSATCNIEPSASSSLNAVQSQNDASNQPQSRQPDSPIAQPATANPEVRQPASLLNWESSTSAFSRAAAYSGQQQQQATDYESDDYDEELLAEVKREIEEENEMARRKLQDSEPNEDQFDDYGEEEEYDDFDNLEHHQEQLPAVYTHEHHNIHKLDSNVKDGEVMEDYDEDGEEEYRDFGLNDRIENRVISSGLEMMHEEFDDQQLQQQPQQQPQHGHEHSSVQLDRQNYDQLEEEEEGDNGTSDVHQQIDPSIAHHQHHSESTLVVNSAATTNPTTDGAEHHHHQQHQQQHGNFWIEIHEQTQPNWRRIMCNLNRLNDEQGQVMNANNNQQQFNVIDNNANIQADVMMQEEDDDDANQQEEEEEVGYVSSDHHHHQQQHQQNDPITNDAQDNQGDVIVMEDCDECESRCGPASKQKDTTATTTSSSLTVPKSSERNKRKRVVLRVDEDDYDDTFSDDEKDEDYVLGSDDDDDEDGDNDEDYGDEDEQSSSPLTVDVTSQPSSTHHHHDIRVIQTETVPFDSSPNMPNSSDQHHQPNNSQQPNSVSISSLTDQNGTTEMQQQQIKQEFSDEATTNDRNEQSNDGDGDGEIVKDEYFSECEDDSDCVVPEIKGEFDYGQVVEIRQEEEDEEEDTTDNEEIMDEEEEEEEDDDDKTQIDDIEGLAQDNQTGGDDNDESRSVDNAPMDTTAARQSGQSNNVQNASNESIEQGCANLSSEQLFNTANQSDDPTVTQSGGDLLAPSTSTGQRSNRAALNQQATASKGRNATKRKQPTSNRSAKRSKQTIEEEDDGEDGEEIANDDREEAKIKVLNLNCTQSNCNVKLDSMDHLHNHLRTVHQLAPLQCFAQNCNARFNERRQIGHHIKLNHPQSTQFPCAVCPKKFDSQTKAYTHWYFTHLTGQFQCNFGSDCAQLTDTRNKMRTHQKTKHEDRSKHLHCTHPGCTVSFTYSTDLKRHQQTHLATNQFHCNWPHCSQQCNQRGNLVRHIRTQHFGLPESLKAQKAKKIVDLRDPNEYVRVVVDE